MGLLKSVLFTAGALLLALLAAGAALASVVIGFFMGILSVGFLTIRVIIFCVADYLQFKKDEKKKQDP